MKRITSLILSIVLVFSLVPAVHVSAAGEFTIRGTDATVSPGEQVSVDLLLENNPGISAINLYYIFNSDYFTLTQVENKVSAFVMTHMTTTVWDAASNFSDDAVLTTLHFDVAENTPVGEYEVEILFLSASNDVFEEVFAQTVSATITVQEAGCAHASRTEVSAKSADCTHPGNHAYFICNDCGLTFKADGVTETTAEAEQIPALGHDFVNGSCTRCGASENGPQIVTQPVNYAGAVNDELSFTVEATGNGLRYQWYFSTDGGKNWGKSGSPGNTTATLKPILRAYRDGYQFYCTVTDRDGNSVNSDVVSMVVKAAEVIITKQPENVMNAVLSQLYYFTVEATGENLEYRWQVSSDGGETWQESWNGGYNTPNLSVRMNANRDGNLYRCKITSGLKIVAYSDAVVLDMQDPSAKLISQNGNVFVTSGKTATFTVNAEGMDLTYAWYRSNDKGTTWIQTFLSGYNTNTLSFAASSGRAAMYMCKITDGSGTVIWSSPVKLQILSAELKILTQPMNMTCADGETVSFTVEAQGDTLKYQWYSSADGVSWTPSYLSGYNTDTFSFAVNTARAAKVYKCVVTDIGGNTVETNPVSVTIA